MKDTINRIQNKVNDTKLTKKLTSLSISELSTLLMNVYSLKTDQISPIQLLRTYDGNRFVKPGTFDVLSIKEMEVKLLRKAKESGYESILLSPTSILGSSSVFKYVHQNNVITALRNTEVLSDPTNAMVIHIASTIKSKETDSYPIKLCTTSRVVRTQPLDSPKMLPHFGLFSMVSVDKRKPSYETELSLLSSQIDYYIGLIQNQYKSISKLELKLSKRPGYKDLEGFFEKLILTFKDRYKNLDIIIDESNLENKYYQGLNYQMFLTKDKERIFIADGGFVDWITQMIGSKKLVTLISGMGIERLLM